MPEEHKFLVSQSSSFRFIKNFFRFSSTYPSMAIHTDFCSILIQSKRIINAHSRHFLALSVLFLLPLSFSIIVYPSIQQAISQSTVQSSVSLVYAVNLPQEQPGVDTKPILLTLLYTVFVFVFTVWAVGSITYSVLQGFYGRPVKLASAIKSGFTSFLPLMITGTVMGLITFGILLIFGLFLFLVVRGIELTGLEIGYSSPYFLGLCWVLLVVLTIVIMHLQVNWSLVYVIVVVESTWGFQPLRRSKSLIKGTRGVSFSLLVLFLFASAAPLLSRSAYAASFGDELEAEWRWMSWMFVLEIVVTSTFLTLVILYNLASNTVLYMYCKAVHGELAGEIAEEFAREYISLPFDDEKVPHVVSVDYNA